MIKKILLALTLATLTTTIYAQSQGIFTKKEMKAARGNSDQYAKKGLIPQVDGKVVFHEVIAMPGKSKDEIMQNLVQWATFRYEPNVSQGTYTESTFFKNIEYAKVKTADKGTGIIECDGAEELIFSIKTLAKNYTQAFYSLHLKATDGKVEFTLDNLSFNVDMGEGAFSRVKAEEWITDEECLNKKGKLRRIPGKYRIKTIDLVDELKKEISECVNK